MRIDAIELFHLSLIPHDTVLVRLASGEASGWGEACAGREPTESAEWAGSVFACLRYFLAPAVRGQSVLTGEQLQTLIARFQGNPIAKSALDGAWWDLKARTHATSVPTLLGGTREVCETSTTLEVMPSIEELLKAIEGTHQKHTIIILKFRAGWDEQMLRAVRQVFPAVPLAIDCDGMCRIGQREMFYRLDDFSLRWIEQPLPPDDLVAHAMLQEAIRTPLCLHQSITSLDRAEQAIDLGSCRMMKIDPDCVGGLTPAVAIHQACSTAGIPCAVGGRYASSAGAAARSALATLAGFSLAGEIADDGISLENGTPLGAAIAHAVI